MSEFNLNKSKLSEMLKDYTDDPTEAGKKWGDYLNRNGLGKISAKHMYYTILAHSRGHIHADHMGTVANYEQHAPIARVQSSTGLLINNHVRYKRISKSHRLAINSLDDQAEFIGPSLLKRLQATPTEIIQTRIASLRRGVSRLTLKLYRVHPNTQRQTVSV